MPRLRRDQSVADGRAPCAVTGRPVQAICEYPAPQAVSAACGVHPQRARTRHRTQTRRARDVPAPPQRPPPSCGGDHHPDVQHVGRIVQHALVVVQLVGGLVVAREHERGAGIEVVVLIRESLHHLVLLLVLHRRPHAEPAGVMTRDAIGTCRFRTADYLFFRCNNGRQKSQKLCGPILFSHRPPVLPSGSSNHQTEPLFAANLRFRRHLPPGPRIAPAASNASAFGSGVSARGQCNTRPSPNSAVASSTRPTVARLCTTYLGVQAFNARDAQEGQ